MSEITIISKKTTKQGRQVVTYKKDGRTYTHVKEPSFEKATQRQKDIVRSRKSGKKAPEPKISKEDEVSPEYIVELENKRAREAYYKGREESDKEFVEGSKGYTVGDVFNAGYNIYPEPTGGVVLDNKNKVVVDKPSPTVDNGEDVYYDERGQGVSSVFKPVKPEMQTQGVVSSSESIGSVSRVPIGSKTPEERAYSSLMRSGVIPPPQGVLSAVEPTTINFFGSEVKVREVSGIDSGSQKSAEGRDILRSKRASGGAFTTLKGTTMVVGGEAKVAAATVAVGALSIPSLAKRIVTKPQDVVGDFVFGTYEDIRNITKPGTIGKIGGSVILSEFGLRGAGVATTGVRSAVFKATKTKVPAIEVFDPKVLVGEAKFPMSKGTPQALKEFQSSVRDGKTIVVTTSSSPLKGTVVGAGRKGSLGLEDPGIYATPLGRASPAFLRIGGKRDVSFTLNPLERVKEIFRRPTTSEIEVTGVGLLPRSVVKKPGFDAIGEFFRSGGADTGMAFITKRSEIGQGSVSRQSFSITKEQALAAENLGIGKGNTFRIEKGTSELEVVIPESSVYVQTRGSRYTRVFGEPVAIREVTVIPKGSDFSVPKGGKVVSGKNINSGSSSVSKLGSSSVLISPISLFPSSLGSGSVSGISGFSLANYSKSGSSFSYKPSSFSLSSVSYSPSSFSLASYSKSGSSFSFGGSGFSFGDSGSSFGGSGFSFGGSGSSGGSSNSGFSSFRMDWKPDKDKVKSLAGFKTSKQRKLAYTPTLYAAGLELKSSEKTLKIASITRSGLGLRPIIQ